MIKKKNLISGVIKSKILKTNVKLFEDYERLLKLVDKETNEGSTKGGAEESASEKGLI